MTSVKPLSSWFKGSCIGILVYYWKDGSVLKKRFCWMRRINSQWMIRPPHQHQVCCNSIFRWVSLTMNHLNRIFLHWCTFQSIDYDINLATLVRWLMDRVWFFSVVTGNEDQLECKKTTYSLGPKLKGFADWLLQVVVSGNFDTIFPAATRVYAQLVEELLKDEAFQATYSRRNELEMLPRVATYFLDRVSLHFSSSLFSSNLEMVSCKFCIPFFLKVKSLVLKFSCLITPKKLKK